jgi:hypothetical protein
MNKVKLYFFKFLVALCLVLFCTGLTVSIATSQQTHARSIPLELAAQPLPTKELASKVLSGIGVANQYDMYFDHAIGIVLTSSNDKFKRQVRELMAREAGWKYVQDDYVARLVADFSTAELKDLLRLSQQPLVQRLLRSEIQAYNATIPKRYKLLNELWNNYNNGGITLPKGR